MDEGFEIEAQALAQVLDELDYFQVLKVAQSASPGEIKAAYYRESRSYHPDRFSTLPPSDMKENIGRIYKRINEAYVCLRDEEERDGHCRRGHGDGKAEILRERVAEALRQEAGEHDAAHESDQAEDLPEEAAERAPDAEG